jgi:hypothetical protein
LSLTLFTSGIVLAAISAYEAYNISQNWSAFYYNYSSQVGSLNCYQNRIVYITEIIITAVIVVTDIGMACLKVGKA